MNKRTMNKRTLTSLCEYFGVQGGTIHQFAEETGIDQSDLLYKPAPTISVDFDLGWFAATTCGKERRLELAKSYKGNIDFWLGVICSKIMI